MPFVRTSVHQLLGKTLEAVTGKVGDEHIDFVTSPRRPLPHVARPGVLRGGVDR